MKRITKMAYERSSTGGVLISLSRSIVLSSPLSSSPTLMHIHDIIETRGRGHPRPSPWLYHRHTPDNAMSMYCAVLCHDLVSPQGGATPPRLGGALLSTRTQHGHGRRSRSVLRLSSLSGLALDEGGESRKTVCGQLPDRHGKSDAPSMNVTLCPWICHAVKSKLLEDDRRRRPTRVTSLR